MYSPSKFLGGFDVVEVNALDDIFHNDDPTFQLFEYNAVFVIFHKKYF